MIKAKIDNKEIEVTQTPILLFVESERSLTFAKLIVNGKHYDIIINGNGKAQMK